MSKPFNNYTHSYFAYLQIEKNSSVHTVKNYRDDLEQFFVFMNEQHIEKLTDVTHQDTRLYLTKLHEKKMARASVSRKISAASRILPLFNERIDCRRKPIFKCPSAERYEKAAPLFYEEEIERIV